jgi:hypothetical protein
MTGGGEMRFPRIDDAFLFFFFLLVRKRGCSKARVKADDVAQ